MIKLTHKANYTRKHTWRGYVLAMLAGAIVGLMLAAQL